MLQIFLHLGERQYNEQRAAGQKLGQAYYMPSQVSVEQLIPQGLQLNLPRWLKWTLYACIEPFPLQHILHMKPAASNMHGAFTPASHTAHGTCCQQYGTCQE